MRRLTIDAGNGEDHQQISHSNPNGATAPSSHMLNGYHQHQHHNKQFFKSKTSHVVDMLLPSSSSSSPPVSVLHHKRRLKKGPIHQQTSKNETTTTGSATTSAPTSEFLTLTCAIGLWYALGVVSIATSKLLLLPSTTTTTTATGTDFRRVHLSPLALTLQQLWIGSTLLKCWFYYAGRRRRRRNSKTAAAAATSGLQAWPCPVMVAPSSSLSSPEEHKNTDHDNLSTSTLTTHRTTTTAASPEQVLRWTAICFALGFLATNFAFSGSAASFVETVKAAEPITSATVAVVYGLETLTGPQQASLGTIVAGVLLATLGDSSSNSNNDLSAGHTLAATLLSSAIVMTSNLCFSFRGLYQKLLRRVASTQVLDDWNLQYRMQCTGVWLLLVPVLLLDFLPTILYGERPTWSTTLPENGRSFVHYILLASINGTAFCSYNLASTYLLTRLTVVSHAALNCLRRVFAIVVTSLLFGVPLTVTKWAGMGLAMMGFGLYTYYKMEQQQQEQQYQLQQYQRRRHRSQGSFGSHGSSVSSSRWSPSRPKTPQQQHSFPLNGKYHQV